MDGISEDQCLYGRGESATRKVSEDTSGSEGLRQAVYRCLQCAGKQYVASTNDWTECL